jgi:hypothetical protein
METCCFHVSLVRNENIATPSNWYLIQNHYGQILKDRQEHDSSLIIYNIPAVEPRSESSDRINTADFMVLWRIVWWPGKGNHLWTLAILEYNLGPFTNVIYGVIYIVFYYIIYALNVRHTSCLYYQLVQCNVDYITYSTLNSLTYTCMRI